MKFENNFKVPFVTFCSMVVLGLSGCTHSSSNTAASPQGSSQSTSKALTQVSPGVPGVPTITFMATDLTNSTSATTIAATNYGFLGGNLQGTVGDNIKYTWSATNASQVYSNFSMSQPQDGCGNSNSNANAWAANTLTGSISAALAPCQAAVTYIINVTAVGLDGVTTVTATNTITVLNTPTLKPAAAPITFTTTNVTKGTSASNGDVLTAQPGDSLTFNWSSNASSLSSNYYISSGQDNCPLVTGASWAANTSTGTIANAVLPDCENNNDYTIVLTAVGSDGVTKSSIAQIIHVLPITQAPPSYFPVELDWDTEGVADTVEIHVGSPDGPLFATSAGSVCPTSPCSAITGSWATQGMTFYLQDATQGTPTSPANTLSVITIPQGAPQPGANNAPPKYTFQKISPALAQAAAKNYVNSCVPQRPTQNVSYHASQPCRPGVSLGSDVAYQITPGTNGSGPQINVAIDFNYLGSPENLNAVVDLVNQALPLVTAFLNSYGININIQAYPPADVDGNIKTFPSGNVLIGPSRVQLGMPYNVITLTDANFYTGKFELFNSGLWGLVPGQIQLDASAIAHELLHRLGIPDRYGADGSGGGGTQTCTLYTQTAPDNDVMVNGGYLPLNKMVIGLVDAKKVVAPLCDPKWVPSGKTSVATTIVYNLSGLGNVTALYSGTLENVDSGIDYSPSGDDSFEIISPTSGTSEIFYNIGGVMVPDPSNGTTVTPPPPDSGGDDGDAPVLDQDS